MVLQLAQAEHKKYWHFEEQFLKEKARAKWHVDGEKNTTYFYNLVNGRRRRLHSRGI